MNLQSEGEIVAATLLPQGHLEESLPGLCPAWEGPEASQGQF